MRTITTILATITALTLAQAATNRCNVTLVWEPSPDTNVVGYNVYYGTNSRTYQVLLPAGTNLTATVSNLAPARTYYFAATAYDHWGLESDYSEECAWTAPALAPRRPSGMRLVSVEVQSSTNLVDWRTVTNLPAVEVGVTNGARWFRARMEIE